MFEKPQSEAGDVLSPTINQTLAVSWVVLFSFRSAGVFLLLLSGLLNVAQLETFVDPVLSRVYMVLSAVTIVVIVLRVMRGMQSKPPSMSSEQLHPSATDFPPASAPDSSTRPPEENPQS